MGLFWIKIVSKAWVITVRVTFLSPLALVSHKEICYAACVKALLSDSVLDLRVTVLGALGEILSYKCL